MSAMNRHRPVDGDGGVATADAVHVDIDEENRSQMPEAARARVNFRVPQLVRLLLAGAATSGQIVLADADYRRPGSMAHVWFDCKRGRQSISAMEARVIALDVMASAERRLRDERATEVAFLTRLWEDSEELASP